MILDLIVLIAVLISAGISFLRGFIREFLTIVGVVGGLLAAFFGGPVLLPLMNGWLGVGDDPDHVRKLFDVIPMNIVSYICSYGLIFAVVVVLLSVLSYFLASGAKAMGLGPVDRALGVMFGVARAAFLLSLLYMVFSLVVNPQEMKRWSFMQSSKTQPMLEEGATWLKGFFPHKDEETLRAQAGEARRQMDETREKVRQMDALRDAAEKAGDSVDNAMDRMKENADSTKENLPADDKSGYKQEQREHLDQLFQTNQ